MTTKTSKTPTTTAAAETTTTTVTLPMGESSKDYTAILTAATDTDLTHYLEALQTALTNITADKKLPSRALMLKNTRKAIEMTEREITERKSKAEAARLEAEAKAKAKAEKKPAVSRKINADGEILLNFLDQTVTTADARTARRTLRKLGLTVNNATKSGNTWTFLCNKPTKTVEAPAEADDKE